MNWHQTIGIGSILNDYPCVSDPDHFYLDDLDRWLQGYFAPQWNRYFDSDEHRAYIAEMQQQVDAIKSKEQRAHAESRRRQHLADEQRRMQGSLL